ncbi:MAG: type II toxin-antitoxin system mRNA interferase toxin, RelE/StbE family [Snowella sp.]|nr:type II toxin-antitoxin system mRNA interferase toxin, RelE/StbE family [Snowella sp.]
MANYQLLFSRQAQKDIAELSPKQKTKLQKILIEILAENPYQGKILKGSLVGLRSYRLNLKDRILYEIYESEKTILIIRAKSHYGD